VAARGRPKGGEDRGGVPDGRVEGECGKYIDANGRIAGTVYPDSTLDGIIIGLERMFSLGSILSSPVVADGVVFVGSTDGHIYALQ